MRYLKYIATGFINGAITMSDPAKDARIAASSFFAEHRGLKSCNVRRASIRPTGEVVYDPDYKAMIVARK